MHFSNICHSGTLGIAHPLFLARQRIPLTPTKTQSEREMYPSNNEPELLAACAMHQLPPWRSLPSQAMMMIISQRRLATNPPYCHTRCSFTQAPNSFSETIKTRFVNSLHLSWNARHIYGDALSSLTTDIYLCNISHFIALLSLAHAAVASL